MNLIATPCERTRGSQKNYEKAILLAWMHGAYCALCGKPVAVYTHGEHGPEACTLDHIIFRSHGGGKSIENLQLAHKICNNRRRAPGLTLNQLLNLPESQQKAIQNRAASRLAQARKPASPQTTLPWVCSQCGRGAATRGKAFDCCGYGWRENPS